MKQTTQHIIREMGHNYSAALHDYLHMCIVFMQIFNPKSFLDPKSFYNNRTDIQHILLIIFQLYLYCFQKETCLSVR